MGRLERTDVNDVQCHLHVTHMKHLAKRSGKLTTLFALVLSC